MQRSSECGLSGLSNLGTAHSGRETKRSSALAFAERSTEESSTRDSDNVLITYLHATLRSQLLQPLQLRQCAFLQLLNDLGGGLDLSDESNRGSWEIRKVSEKCKQVLENVTHQPMSQSC